MSIEKNIIVTPEDVYSMGPSPSVVMAGLRMCDKQIGTVNNVYVALGRCIKEQTVRNCLNKLVDLGFVLMSERVDDRINTTFLYCEKK